MGTPIVWLGGALVICIGLFVAGVIGLFNAAQKAQLNAGLQSGKATAAVATVEAATKTASVEREAEAETPLITVSAELVAICKRSASCKERGSLK